MHDPSVILLVILPSKLVYVTLKQKKCAKFTSCLVVKKYHKMANDPIDRINVTVLVWEHVNKHRSDATSQVYCSSSSRIVAANFPELLCGTHCKKDNLVCQNWAHNVILFATSPAQQDRIICKGPKSPSSPPQELEGGAR